MELMVDTAEVDLSYISPKKIKTVKERRRMDLKFDEFNEERKNKQKALASGYPRIFPPFLCTNSPGFSSRLVLTCSLAG